MKRQRHRKVIISGGGTGGHIFPAISIANALKAADSTIDIHFVGALGRMEMDLVPAAGYSITGLPVSGFHRKKLWKNARVLVRLFRSIRQAYRIVRDFSPDVAVGVGGYASGPLLWAAARRGVAIVLQEQNSYAGVTNRLLAGRASVICVAYEGMEKYFPASKIILSGNPVRPGFARLSPLREEALRHFALDGKRKVVLVLGGSQGAGAVNAALGSSAAAVKESGIDWLWQAGRYYYQDMKDRAVAGGLSNVRVLGFIDRMDLAYAAADIIVSRAGAGTISELCIVGKPVILIPSPNVAEDHQTRNAMALVSRDAALMLRDGNAGGELISRVLELAGSADEMERLSRNIAAMALPQASETIAGEVFKLMGDD